MASNTIYMVSDFSRGSHILFSKDTYDYHKGNEYYAYLTWNPNSDNRWYLRVNPANPKTIAVDHSYASDKWYTARAITIGNTAHNVDGSGTVTWTKAEIIGSGTTGQFLRGDHTWTNYLDGVLVTSYISEGAWAEYVWNKSGTYWGGLGYKDGTTLKIGACQQSGQWVDSAKYGLSLLGFLYLGTSTEAAIRDIDGNWIVGKAGNGTNQVSLGTTANAQEVYVNNSKGSIKINSSGDTVATGRVWAYYNGESYFRAVNNNTGVNILLDSDGDGTHGIWSTGYYNGSSFTSSGKWLIRRTTANKVIVDGYATSATYLYADDSPYRYTDSNPYYAHISYNTNSDGRWYMRVYPETPKILAVDYSYNSGSAATAGAIRDAGNGTSITAYYSQSGVSSFDWATVWSGYSLRYISKADFGSQMDGLHKWARIGGDTFTGPVRINGTDNSGTDARLYIDHASNNDWGIIIAKSGSYDYGIDVRCNSGGSYGIQCTGRITGTKVYGAVWNDYAECRAANAEPGRVVYETTLKTMQKTYARLQPGCRVVSDTYGMCIGETEEAQTPIAVCGRVLVYPYRDRNEYELGAAVCSAPNGTVDIMTREEIREYPERIIGTVSEIPDYDTWLAGERDGNHIIEVNGRIWIYIK